MSIVGHGVDLVEVERLAGMIEAHVGAVSRAVLQRSRMWRSGSGGRERGDGHEYFAGRFAAKEAVLKALGTGLSGGIRWRDVEVTREMTGRPGVALSGRAAEVAAGLGVTGWLLSISHVERLAMASAIATAE